MFYKSFRNNLIPTINSQTILVFERKVKCNMKVCFTIQTNLKSSQARWPIDYKDISKKSHINECIDLHTHEIHDEFS